MKPPSQYKFGSGIIRDIAQAIPKARSPGNTLQPAQKKKKKKNEVIFEKRREDKCVNLVTGNGPRRKSPRRLAIVADEDGRGYNVVRLA